MTTRFFHNTINNKTKLLLLALASLCIIFIPHRISALSGSEFIPGRIIDDAVFYNSSTMTPAQIQQFLEVKLPVCDTMGTKPYQGTTRAAYAASKGVSTPFVCLKDYSQSVPAIVNSGSDHCGGNIAAGNKTAAQIIYDVAQACGVNPQILIALLQKEQSLVTDDWPWPIQYRSATGYGCPDTAPCDSEYYGFFNQVYQAAKAYKRYRANPANYNYRAGRNNTILWHPNAACGTSSVYIENQATAGLYIYTPYRPNQAALNNLYGEGDGCSSYGNRNLWRMFSDWFGTTNLQDFSKTNYISGDFNGDGRDDLFNMYEYTKDHAIVLVRYGTADGGFTSDSVIWRSGPGNWESARTKLASGDFNGDGKDDVAAFYDYGGSDVGLWVFNGVNSGFTLRRL